MGTLTGPSGDSDSDSKLDVNETWTYTGAYTVTQADIDNGGNILNTATADSTQTGSESASTSVPVEQKPDLNITKTASVPGGTADVVGEVISYSIVVDNNGNQTLTGVTVSDPKLGTLTGPSGDSDSDSQLDVNETWTYTGSYTVTQADIDNGGNILNTATADSTQTGSESASTSVPVTQRPDLDITKTATVADGATAVDAALDVINYSIVVDNNGNTTLTGVTVSDPRISNLSLASGDTDSDSKLDVNETWTYTGSYTVTQADIDNGGNILNTATADSTQTGSESASTSVPVTQRPDLDITKTVSSITNPNGTAGGTTVDQVGDVVRYAITVDNNGNTTLTGVTVSDPRISNLSLASGDTDSDSKLDVNETWTYTGSYTVTQANLDAGGNLLNTATADSTQTPSESASTSVPVKQNPAINIDKVTVYGTQTGDGLTGVVAGQPISWRYTVTNPGNVSLSNVFVKDNNGTTTNTADDFNATYVSGDTNNDGKLNPGESWSYTASGTAVAGSYNNIGTASGSIGGTTVTKTDSSSYFGTADVGQIAPTGVTCDQYIQGTAPDFSQFYASQGGVVQYSTQGGLINQTNPGVFFYYTGLSNTIKGFDGPDAGTAPDPLTVFIDQNNSSSNVNRWNFDATKNDVKLYRVTDVNNNGIIDAADTCVQQQLNNNQIKIQNGDVTVDFIPATIGSLYVIGVKYDTSTVKGINVGTSNPTVKYNFQTDVGNDGFFEETDSKGITLQYKFPLKLQGTPTVGGSRLTQAELAPVVDAAIDYWAKQGADSQSLNKLKNTDVLIGDLGGSVLGTTDGSMVTIDDDASGYGWSGSLDGVASNRVDLFSAVTHEFGHILGYDHDAMGETLGVGERHLPLDLEDKNLFKDPFPNSLSGRSLF
ncbi:hypothetical protein MiSe_68080 [Microseira wollei NIES-4236]|uniref:DUF7507 domain-containing protein n=1 Tax=Microseira wollei NIES-4236 TaxID=2530354 RepID=A0AAV3WLM9_9CYAN|nr:hypothetical protein MiSe_68080 [Microseira wollei NIES-4236]